MSEGNSGQLQEKKFQINSLTPKVTKKRRKPGVSRKKVYNRDQSRNKWNKDLKNNRKINETKS